jgi:hypothetical protein
MPDHLHLLVGIKPDMALSDSGSARVPRAGFGVAPQPPAHPTLPSGATPDGATGTVALPAKTATLAGLYDPLAMAPALAPSRFGLGLHLARLSNLQIFLAS